VWEKFEFAFLVEPNDATNPFLDMAISIFCDNTSEMIVLFDDIQFGPPPPCTVTPSIDNGGFENGLVPNWNIGFANGDETIAITNSKARTGTRSAMITFPSISNSISFSNEFQACVGTKYSFKLYYFVPKAHKGVQCSIGAYAFYTGESIRESVTVYDTWNELKLDFTAGGAAMTVVWNIFCLNQLQKVVFYVDDVSVTPS
jgi:hypothetical protein